MATAATAQTDVVARVAARLEEAVQDEASPPLSLELLKSWLQGFDLPFVGTDDEPHQWLMRGLAETQERARCERRLAAGLARWLDTEPDTEAHGEYPDRLVYNGLMLAAGLSSPDELARPLLAMYERRRLEGEYQGLGHPASLRMALAANQRDAGLEPVWLDMAIEKGTEFLPGWPMDGVEGLMWMPDPERGRGYPALGALGKAVLYQAELLADQPNGLRRWDQLLDRVVNAYPGQENRIVTHLMLKAIPPGGNCPAWALSALEARRLALSDRHDSPPPHLSSKKRRAAGPMKEILDLWRVSRRAVGLQFKKIGHLLLKESLAVDLDAVKKHRP
jgi:hypothetical protein